MFAQERMMDIKRQGQLVEVLGSEMSNKYSVNTTDSSANTKTHSFGGRFLIPEPVVKFFHDGRELEISLNKDEDPYAAIARYVFELNDEIEKLKSELAKAQAVPEGFVVVAKELPEKIAEKMAFDRIDKPIHENDPVWSEIAEESYKNQVKLKKWEFWRDYKAMIEAQEQSHE